MFFLVFISSSFVLLLTMKFAVREGQEVKKIRSRVPGIPHLQLFGQLADLRNYRVRGVMAGKIILAEEAGTKKLVVFKTLHKAPAVYKKAKTSLLPINIAHMVKLLKYFETDDCVYLMLVSLNNNLPDCNI